ncbi:uncharacterized protein LOC143875915 [Tasmannia lanceolata]|uniref:uncharacterized protein LOC143875915 n=1 Tax=Tasmannia lanceolata TaxID=3420 RepID=UPI004063D3D4
MVMRKSDRVKVTKPPRRTERSLEGEETKTAAVKKRGTDAPYVPARCSPASFKSAMDRIKFKPVHFHAIEKTPFRHLFGMEDIIMHKPLIRAIHDKWTPGTNTFTLGSINVPFLPRDVALALGLPLTGERMDVVRVLSFDRTKPQPKVPGWPYPEANVKASVIENEITALVRERNKVSIEKTVKYVLLHLFASVLFPKSAHRADELFWPYIDDIGNIGNYNWAMAVYDWLVDYLDRVSKGGRYLGGCSLVIQVWLYEHTTFWIPTNPTARPRVLKWDWKANESKTYRLVEQKQIKKSEVVVTLKVSLLEKSQYLQDEDVDETMEVDKEQLESEGIVLGVESEMEKGSSEDESKHIKFLAREGDVIDRQWQMITAAWEEIRKREEDVGKREEDVRKKEEDLKKGWERMRRTNEGTGGRMEGVEVEGVEEERKGENASQGARFSSQLCEDWTDLADLGCDMDAAATLIDVSAQNPKSHEEIFGTTDGVILNPLQRLFEMEVTKEEAPSTEVEMKVSGVRDEMVDSELGSIVRGVKMDGRSRKPGRARKSPYYSGKTRKRRQKEGKKQGEDPNIPKPPPKKKGDDGKMRKGRRTTLIERLLKHDKRQVDVNYIIP